MYGCCGICRTADCPSAPVKSGTITRHSPGSDRSRSHERDSCTTVDNGRCRCPPERTRCRVLRWDWGCQQRILDPTIIPAKRHIDQNNRNSGAAAAICEPVMNGSATLAATARRALDLRAKAPERVYSAACAYASSGAQVHIRFLSP
jgi:hypothetical protein